MKEILINLDRRIVFIFVFVGAIIPTLYSFELPIKATRNVRSIYDTIENIADEGGGTVLISFDYGPGSMPEVQPMSLSILRHCFSRGIKVVGMNHWPQGVGLAQQALDITSKELSKTYGEDYAFLGFKTGGGTLVISMGEDFHGAFAQDLQGNATKDLPVTRNITSLKDFDYVISLAAGNTPDGVWIPFGQERYKFKFGIGCTAVMAPDMFPYLQSGQMNGLIGGLAGAAEYESLIKTPGSATDGMRPQSIVHLVIIAFIILGNTIYFKYGRQTGGAQ